MIIVDNDSEEVITDWRPRPSITTTMVKYYKTTHGKLTTELKENLQMWYNKDENILAEIVGLLPLK